MDGNENQWSGNVTMGALTSKTFLQGPLWKKRTTIAMAFRRSNFDLLTQTIANAVFKDSNNINRYNFWDFNTKINHRFSEKAIYRSHYTREEIVHFLSIKIMERLTKSAYTKRESRVTFGAINWGV